jgi:asparagine synthase (glutamine-hydrolysing)
MCGIAGLFRTDGRSVSVAEIHALIEPLAHRGPDGEGVYACGPLGLGMKRLAIIDVAGGNQPIFNEDGTLAIVCNGEIYNHKPLRADLEKAGHHFKTHSDVEVILHLYEEFGEACFSRLNGMFAVAIADFRNKKLVIARDRFGQKPLYLWQSSTGLAFASELKALVRLPGFSRELSRDALASYLTFRYIPSPRSVFKNVEKLPPGSYLVVDHSGHKETRRYWEIDLRSPKETSNASEMREQLAASVDRHLMSERPLGVFLSGGLDSAAIVSCMHELGHREIHTYTVGFQGFADNEFENARRVASHFKTDHHEVVLSAEGFWDSLATTSYFLDEPMADLTAIPLYGLSEQARKDVVVVLSGEGSDELLAGYTGAEELRGFFDRLDSLRALGAPARAALRLKWPAGIERRLRTLAGTHADYLARDPTSMGLIFNDEFRRTNCPDLDDCPDTLKPLSDYFASHQGWHGLNLHLGGLIEWWLPDDLLHKADRMSMANSIELRCPFLDADFADYCSRLSLDDKAQSPEGEAFRKVALKRAFAAHLPDGIAYQRKKGFVIPVYAWMKEQFYECAKSELARSTGLGSSLFSREARGEMLERGSKGDLLSQRRIWSLVVLNKWADRWL